MGFNYIHIIYNVAMLIYNYQKTGNRFDPEFSRMVPIKKWNRITGSTSINHGRAMNKL